MDKLKPRAANTTPLTPLTFLERTALVYGDCPSIIYNTTTYTWGQTNRRCLQAASAIAALGITKNQVVSVLAPNVPATYELHFAIPMAGAVINSINTRLNPATIAVILQHSEAKLVFVYQNLCSLVLRALSLLPSNHPHPFLVLIEEDEGDIDQLTYEFLSSYEQFIQRGDPEFDWVRPTNEWDPITLNYTSGTTSSPKGVVHCHRGSFIAGLSALIDWGVPHQPVYLWTLPMFHSNGWSFTWALAAVAATSICLRNFTGDTIHAMIRRHRVTHMCAAPVVLSMLANSAGFAQPFDWPVHILTGGSPPPALVLLKAESMGFIVAHGYGLTETLAPVVSCAWKPQWNNLPAEARARFKARQGVRTIGMTEIDVVDPDTRKPVHKDGRSIGEIVFKGGSVLLGYFKDPRATSKCMGEDGWFRTGDLGVMHPDGYLEIRDRAKDIIISGGENISSVEVESVLYSYPGVSEAAVVAQPHDYWGETPCAFLSFIRGIEVKHTEMKIIEYCRDKLPHFMVPKKVVIQDELPKTATGKIQKFLLREMAREMVTAPSQTSRL